MYVSKIYTHCRLQLPLLDGNLQSSSYKSWEVFISWETASADSMFDSRQQPQQALCLLSHIEWKTSFLKKFISRNLPTNSLILELMKANNFKMLPHSLVFMFCNPTLNISQKRFETLLHPFIYLLLHLFIYLAIS